MREWFLHLIAIAVRRVVQPEFDRLAQLIIASSDEVHSMRSQLSTIVAIQQQNQAFNKPERKDEEAIIEARKRILVPGLTKELEAQIDWDRMG